MNTEIVIGEAQRLGCEPVALTHTAIFTLWGNASECESTHEDQAGWRLYTKNGDVVHGATLPEVFEHLQDYAARRNDPESDEVSDGNSSDNGRPAAMASGRSEGKGGRSGDGSQAQTPAAE